MQVLKKDKDYMKIKVESLEDLWTLKQVLKKNDIVGKKDFRSVNIDGVKDKKPAYLKISLEKIEFDENQSVLKILGNIIECPDYVSKGHHSFKIRENDVIDLWKSWNLREKLRFEESLRKKEDRVLICVVDEREASFGEATGNRIKYLFSIHSSNSGKMYEKGEDKKFVKDITKKISEMMENYDYLVLGGPGFKKEEIFNNLSEDLKKRCVLESSSVVGETGIKEVVKRGALEKINANIRVKEEMKKLKEFFSEIAKEGKVTYGIENVKNACEMGAVEELLITEDKLKNEEIEDLLKMVENQGGKITIIHLTHDYGKMLGKIGGIGAFLRYKVE